MALERQSAALPAAHPSYILRGHASQIHCVHVVHHNTRLLTADADGWVVYWKIETKRALAVWKAHDGAILGTAAWGRDKVITHGRDNSLRIWQLRPEDEAALSTVLPAEVPADPPKPWLLHMLPVNTLNFCAFSMCYQQPAKRASTDSVLIAVPGRDDKKLEVYQFPDEKLRCVVPRAQSTDTGMAMAVKLAHSSANNRVMVLTGYEGGLTAVHLLPRNVSASIGVAQLVYLSQPHTQPILSLDIAPDAKTYFTSSADATIAAHRIPEVQSDVDYEEPAVTGQEPTVTGQEPTATGQEPTATEQEQTAHPEEQSEKRHSESTNSAESDPKPNSAPDPIPSTPPLTFKKQPISFPKQRPISTSSPATRSTLSSIFSAAPKKPTTPITPAIPTTPSPAYKTTSTKHAGQQSLTVRSDGRLLVTGGWDARIRIYSTKTLKEVAVLKWHKEGVYAVGFGEMLSEGDLVALREEEGVVDKDRGEDGKKGTALGRLQRKREEQMQTRHWVVAGAKDGKVSLWEVF